MTSPDDANLELARVLRRDRTAILAAWEQRLRCLPLRAPSPAGRGDLVLEWLAHALEESARGEHDTSGPPDGESFGTGRAIAELTLLAETIDQLLPGSVIEPLHRVIDAAIASGAAGESARASRVSDSFVVVPGPDLRDPLSAILAGAQMLRRDLCDERSARVLSRIIASGERLGRMIEQMQPFARARSGGQRPPDDLVREEELEAFERLASRPSQSTVTAQMFGATSLRERAPQEYADIVERYGSLLGTALDRKAYRGQGEFLSDDVRALAERLGDLGAGPREVNGVHAQALRDAVRGVSAARTQVLLGEGRLLALELMGNLANYYRRRAQGSGRAGGAGA